MGQMPARTRCDSLGGKIVQSGEGLERRQREASMARGCGDRVMEAG